MGQKPATTASRAFLSKATSRILRHRLAATTILCVAPFLGYSRNAFAYCDSSPSPTYFCSGTILGQTITGVDNANATTVASPPFDVLLYGLTIAGDGHIQFTDNYASSINNYLGPGLVVGSTGDIDQGAQGSVTITTNGDITGYTDGILTQNYGSGGMNVTADGAVSGFLLDGIYAYNKGSYLAITTGDQSVITGGTNGIDARNIGSGGLSVTADGVATGFEFDGIYAYNKGTYLTITTGDQSVITGDDNGIDARNFGSGDLTITTNGEVTGNSFDGIYAKNEGANLYVTVNAASTVEGIGNGIGAYNLGSGNLAVTVYGDVAGRAVTTYSEVADRNYDGVHAYNSGQNLIITTVAGSTVYGFSNGMDVRNYGTGYLKVTAEGEVNGRYNDAIFAKNYGTELSITTAPGTLITGGGNGIGAYNYGTGDLSVLAGGLVRGYADNGDGIHAYNSPNSQYIEGADNGGNLNITASPGSAVIGREDGIQAYNYGRGDLNIKVYGAVTGENGNGIFARNIYGPYFSSQIHDFVFGYGANLSITTGPASVVAGKTYGINAYNGGFGNLTITANGEVSGEEEDGIYAKNGTYGYDLTVTLGAGGVVTGGDDGIYAKQYGDGELAITVNGTVTGNGLNSESLDYGIGVFALNYFGTNTTIDIGGAGLVQGAYSGIVALSEFGQQISITNEGLVRNLSAESAALAIYTSGGATNIENNGDLIGTVKVNAYSSFNDRLDNNGFWNTANGHSYFGLGEDTLYNTGTMVGADDPATLEVTNISGVEYFKNDGGFISMVDGQAGDQIIVAGDNEGDLTYEGSNNGRLAVDAELGPGGVADKLNIDGDTTGTTLVHVNVVAATGANYDGIPVVIVTNGNTEEDNFNLGSPVNGGFFTWDLKLDGNQHVLYTTGIGVGADEFPAGFDGAQDLWNQTTGSVHERQADLRALFEGMGVTPVADFGAPVAPTPLAPRVTPGFWFKGVGAYIERDGEQGGFSLDRKQTIFGGMAGFDVGTQDVGDALFFGIFGGYLDSDLKFDATNSKWNYEGPTVGAYATYLDRHFYLDATVKADFLDIDIDPDDLDVGADDADSDALNVGGRIDTGYKLGESVYVEPQATLAAVYTDLDDVDVFGGTVEFDNSTSVRGRLGMRLGFDHTASNAAIYSGDVTASVWENFTGDSEVTIVNSGVPDFGASGDVEDTIGDISLGFSVVGPIGWSSFIRGNYQFADDYEAVAGNAGLRYVW